MESDGEATEAEDQDLEWPEDGVLRVEVDDDTLLFWLLMAKRHGRTVDDEVKVYLTEFYRRRAYETGGLDPEAISPEALGESRSPTVIDTRVRSLLQEFAAPDIAPNEPG